MAPQGSPNILKTTSSEQALTYLNRCKREKNLKHSRPKGGQDSLTTVLENLKVVSQVHIGTFRTHSRFACEMQFPILILLFTVKFAFGINLFITAVKRHGVTLYSAFQTSEGTI